MAGNNPTRHSRSGLNTDFPRLLMLLRKERGVSQKQVAEDLGISQALLSHYEKGIRECGLDFVVRAAEYYGVSCDYLLGRSPHRTGAALTLPEQQESDGAAYAQRVLVNSANIVFSLLEKIKNESLSREVTAYLYAALYKIFRDLYSADAKNPQGLFSVDVRMFSAAVEAEMSMAEAKSRYVLSGESIGDCKAVAKEDLPRLNAQVLSEAFPEEAPALFELLRQVEDRMQGR